MTSEDYTALMEETDAGCLESGICMTRVWPQSHLPRRRRRYGILTQTHIWIRLTREATAVWAFPVMMEAEYPQTAVIPEPGHPQMAVIPEPERPQMTEGRRGSCVL